jgi:hypothetical protein
MSVYQMRVSAVCVLAGARRYGATTAIISLAGALQYKYSQQQQQCVYSGAVCLMARKILLCWLNSRLLLLL